MYLTFASTIAFEKNIGSEQPQTELINMMSACLLWRSALDMKSSHDRIAAILAHEEPDCVGFMDADTWMETVERWKSEGMPREVDGAWLNMEGLRLFGMDIYSVFPPAPKGYDQVVLEEHGEFQVVRNPWGGKMKMWKHRSGPKLHLEPAVKQPEDFEKIAPFFEASNEGISLDLKQTVEEAREEFFVTLNVVGIFELSMDIFGGLGPTIVLMQKRPEFMSGVFATISDYWARIAEEYADLVDALWIFDDLGSRNGPFFPPELYRQVVMPAHKRICSVFQKRKLPILLHSDGCLTKFMPLFLECGFEALHPIQVKAGMDLGSLKEEYGDRMVLFGGMDAEVLASGDPGLIKKEVMLRIGQAAPGGGYIAACDGPVPPSVSLASYNLFTRALKRYGKYPR